jgi:hypothetical protein
MPRHPTSACHTPRPQRHASNRASPNLTELVESNFDSDPAYESCDHGGSDAAEDEPVAFGQLEGGVVGEVGLVPRFGRGFAAGQGWLVGGASQ